MTLFKLHYFLLLITVCKHFGAVTAADDENEVTIRHDMINRLVWLQNLNRGCVAQPNIKVEDMRSMSLATLGELVQEAYVELKCSYLYFTLTHLYLIKIYISNPTTLLGLTEGQLNGITFTKESATMLALVYANPEQWWKTIRLVMWLIHTFAEKTSNFLVKNRSDDANVGTAYVSVIFAYEAIKTLLEEFTQTLRCKAYDPVSGRPDNMTYVEKIISGVVGDKETVDSELSNNKDRFWAQTNSNAQVGFIPRDIQRFSVDKILFGVEQEGRGEMTTTLEKIFGVRLDWQSVRTMLQHNYDLVIKTITKACMHQYIEALVIHQYQVVRLLKVVAIRIVVAYLIQLKHTIKTRGRRVMPNHMGHNKRVANGLQAFAELVYLQNDAHLTFLIELMRKQRGFFDSPESVDQHIQIIYRILEGISTKFNMFNVRFDRFMTDDADVYKQATTAAIRFAKEKSFDISAGTDVLYIEVYVEFLKTIADFTATTTFGNILSTDEFKRFQELEKEAMT